MGHLLIPLLISGCLIFSVWVSLETFEVLVPKNFVKMLPYANSHKMRNQSIPSFQRNSSNDISQNSSYKRSRATISSNSHKDLPKLDLQEYKVAWCSNVNEAEENQPKYVSNGYLDESNPG